MLVKKLLFGVLDKIRHRRDVNVLFNGNVVAGRTYSINGNFSDYDMITFWWQINDTQTVCPPLTIPISLLKLGAQMPVYVATMASYGYIYMTVKYLTDNTFQVVQLSAGSLGTGLKVYGIIGGGTS